MSANDSCMNDSEMHIIKRGEVLKSRIRYTCYIVICTLLGLFQVASASKQWAQFKFNDPYYFSKRQIIFAFVGFICFFVASKVDMKKLKRYNNFFIIISFIMLILVLIPGIGVQRNGSRSWFKIASILIQPSEFFKLACILKVSEILSRKRKIVYMMKDLGQVGILACAGFLLILLQPDFGSGVVMLASIVIIVIIADSPMHFFVKTGLMGLCGLVGLILSAPYRLARITSFIDPWQDPLGSGFQIIQSLYAIAPGGLLGQGFGDSIQKQFYLPEPQTDFIFSIYCEERGLIGGIFLILLYIGIIYEGCQMAYRCHDRYLCYVVMGIIALLGIQVLINLGVVVGLFPVTGITLPLFSYGGSSLVVVMSMLGIVSGISRHNEK